MKKLLSYLKTTSSCLFSYFFFFERKICVVFAVQRTAPTKLYDKIHNLAKKSLPWKSRFLPLQGDLKYLAK